jgi:hypothetical protein
MKMLTKVNDEARLLPIVSATRCWFELRFSPSSRQGNLPHPKPRQTVSYEVGRSPLTCPRQHPGYAGPRDHSHRTRNDHGDKIEQVRISPECPLARQQKWCAARYQSPRNSSQIPAHACIPEHNCSTWNNCDRWHTRQHARGQPKSEQTRVNTGDGQYNCSTWNNFAGSQKGERAREALVRMAVPIRASRFCLGRRGNCCGVRLLTNRKHREKNDPRQPHRVPIPCRGIHGDLAQFHALE